jgi:hypothetical protein
MGEKLRLWLHNQDNPVLQNCCYAVDQAHSLYSGLKNIEALLTDLESPGTGSPALSLEPTLRRDLSNSFLISIREFFRTIACGQAKLYQEFARHVRAGDTVVTFNYDVELERALKKQELWEITDGYGFSIGIPQLAPSKVRTLKLHGSVNWLGLLFGGNFGGFQVQAEMAGVGTRPVIFGYRDFEYLGYPKEVQDPESHGVARSGGIPAIIMPTRNKRFYLESSLGREWEMFWDHLWKQAQKALRSSDEVVLIGYSMPPADQRARNLLLENVPRHARLRLFCGSSNNEVRAEFASHGFNQIETFGDSRFEAFLSQNR